jgi:broad specificity phosphatase PhoE
MSENKRQLLLVRHGSTHRNSTDTSVDRIRSWDDVPLNAEGRDQARKISREIANDPPDAIVSSDLCRAHESAKMLAKACGMSISEVSQAFRPWNVGKYAGKLSKDAIPILIEYIGMPDKKVPGGESFNDFRARFFSGLADAAREHAGVLAIVAHTRNERLLQSWKAAGYPANGDIDAKVFATRGDHTGTSATFNIPVDRLKAVAAKKERK